MTQIAGRRRRKPKFFFSSLSHHFHDWVTGYASHSNAQAGVQWLATPLSQLDPLQLTSRGWSSPAILPTWDWTNNRKVISPTPTPTKPRWLWQLRLTQSIYNPNGAQLLRSVHYVVPASKVKKLKLNFTRCCDVIAAMWCCNAVWLILWFLCLIMTHRGNPYLLFLTVEAWGGAYTFWWSRCIITN